MALGHSSQRETGGDPASVCSQLLDAMLMFDGGDTASERSLQGRGMSFVFSQHPPLDEDACLVSLPLTFAEALGYG